MVLLFEQREMSYLFFGDAGSNRALIYKKSCVVSHFCAVLLLLPGPEHYYIKYIWDHAIGQRFWNIDVASLVYKLHSLRVSTKSDRVEHLHLPRFWDSEIKMIVWNSHI